LLQCGYCWSDKSLPFCGHGIAKELHTLSQRAGSLKYYNSKDKLSMTRKYTFLKLAQEALLMSNEPLTSTELWELAAEHGLDKKLGSQGLTPWISLNAVLILDTRDNPESEFIRLDGRPARFSLKDREKSKRSLEFPMLETLPSNSLEDDDEEKPELEMVDHEAVSLARSARIPYTERELHPFLSSFAKYGLGAVLTKTIFHENSSKRNWTEWLHPDIVGFWFPFEDYTPELLALAGNVMSIARFYSFEMKREITFSNLRSSFFQAVSNSSWAHEGYLVAANIDETESFRGELGRLSGSFGIGVIELVLDDPESSQIICPAKRKLNIDWDGANKLAKENPQFKHFLKSARIDMSNCKLHESEYDEAPPMDKLKTISEKWKPVTKANVFS